MTTFAAKFCFLILFLVIFPSVLSTRTPKFKAENPCMRMQLYYHDKLFDGTQKDKTNATSVATANPTKLAPGSQFGMLVVFNDPITRNDKYHSLPTANTQGFYFYDRKDTYSAWFAFTLVFNSSEHRGTLNIMGADTMPEKTRDLSVVGGTGDFFMARGIATLQTELSRGNIIFAPRWISSFMNVINYVKIGKILLRINVPIQCPS